MQSHAYGMFGVCQPRIGEFSLLHYHKMVILKKKYYDKEMKKIAALNSMFANRIEKSSTVDWGMGGWEVSLLRFNSFFKFYLDVDLELLQQLRWSTF